MDMKKRTIVIDFSLEEWKMIRKHVIDKDIPLNMFARMAILEKYETEKENETENKSI